MSDEYIEVLLKVDLFKNISRDDLGILLGCIRPRKVSFKKGEIVAIAGESFSGIGIVLKGEVMVTKENAAGNRVVMGKMPQGHLFGEIIAFSDVNQWPATVITTEDSLLMFIEANRILGNCESSCSYHRTLILNMMTIVSKKALQLNKKVEYLAIKGMREKLATYFIEQHQINHKKTFNLSFNRNELAEFLNVSRPSMSREIARMKDEGIIDYYKSSFKIIDLELLRSCLE